MSSTSDRPSQLQIVGGAYREFCLRPRWAEVFGSGGRAASAAAALGARPNLWCYGDDGVRQVLHSRAALEDYTAEVTLIDQSPRFDYDHGLASPHVFGLSKGHPPIHLSGSCVLRFGMLEGEGVISAEQAVYDPQDPTGPARFSANGSQARRLALVLNRHEAVLWGGSGESLAALGKAIQTSAGAEVVVIKNGARGALVCEGGRVDEVPAYQTESVWKIGSGDCFAAHFAVRWMLEGKSAAESADQASLATAYYSETRGFADPELLRTYVPKPVRPSARCLAGRAPTVYLAGPFFNLPQLWLVDQARNNLRAAGLQVFSPYHDVGLGDAEDVVEADLVGIDEADAVFAIVDGMDPGTLFEIGYARAKGKAVTVYSETGSDEHHKMLLGTNCSIERDYVTAIYRTVWTACAL